MTRPCSDITCVRLVGDLDMDIKALRDENASLKTSLSELRAERDRYRAYYGACFRVVDEILPKDSRGVFVDKMDDARREIDARFVQLT